MGEALSLQFQAARDSIPRARRAIKDLCAKSDTLGHRLADIQIAVTEACTNCVRHAYGGFDDSSAYTLEARLDSGNLIVVVSDEGRGLEGFTPGLGMTLIHQTADRVLVSSPEGGGARIEMHFAPAT